MYRAEEIPMSDDVRVVIFIASVLISLILLSRQLERRWPIEANQRRSDVLDDWKATGVQLALAWSLGPLSSACGLAIVAACGGGLIPLRADGWWFVPSLVGFILFGDLYRYAVHRVQHAVPFLWAMHSFHHSAEALTFVTGARHHWLERVIVAAFLPVMGIMFQIPTPILLVSSIVYFFPDSCAHLNVRFPLGRFVTWLNNPQWHRIHHSTQPEHLDKNFCSLLPIWDILFGTAWIPDKDEYPATGLEPGVKVGILTSIVWPFRHYFPEVDERFEAWLHHSNWAGMGRIYARLSGSHDA
jgi:sterol desaturase/sphingolipid hydroxylase (fatty acid hydroxylase superfamily)